MVKPTPSRKRGRPPKLKLQRLPWGDAIPRHWIEEQRWLALDNLDEGDPSALEAFRKRFDGYEDLLKQLGTVAGGYNPKLRFARRASAVGVSLQHERDRFLRAMNRVYPEVLKALWAGPGRAILTAAGSQGCPFKRRDLEDLEDGLEAVRQVPALDEALRKWGCRFNLDEEWVYQAAVHTIGVMQIPRDDKPLFWAGASVYVAASPALDLPPKPPVLDDLPSGPTNPDTKPVEAANEDEALNEYVSKLLQARQLYNQERERQEWALRPPTWNPQFQSEVQFRDEVERYISKVRGLCIGFGAVQQQAATREDLHFEWLARYQVAGENYAAIAESSPPTKRTERLKPKELVSTTKESIRRALAGETTHAATDKAVRKAVVSLAKFLGLRLREPGK